MNVSSKEKCNIVIVHVHNDREKISLFIRICFTLIMISTMFHLHGQVPEKVQLNIRQLLSLRNQLSDFARETYTYNSREGDERWGRESEASEFQQIDVYSSRSQPRARKRSSAIDRIVKDHVTLNVHGTPPMYTITETELFYCRNELRLIIFRQYILPHDDGPDERVVDYISYAEAGKVQAVFERKYDLHYPKDEDSFRPWSELDDFSKLGADTPEHKSFNTFNERLVWAMAGAKIPSIMSRSRK